jgi:hypothetical protein
MVAKISEGKRRAFLKAFAQSGSVTLAAEQAGLSRWWVSLTRRAEPAFDESCRAAKAASAERLAGGGCNRPPRGWERRGGVPLVVQRTSKGPPQVVRAPGGWRWTPRAEARFLGWVRQFNNVRLACRFAGMTLSSFEAHWRRWPDFRRRVEEARGFARIRIDAAVKADRKRPLGDVDPEAIPPGMSINEMINQARRQRPG